MLAEQTAHKEATNLDQLSSVPKLMYYVFILVCVFMFCCFLRYHFDLMGKWQIYNSNCISFLFFFLIQHSSFQCIVVVSERIWSLPPLFLRSGLLNIDIQVNDSSQNSGSNHRNPSSSLQCEHISHCSLFALTAYNKNLN